MTFLPYEQVKSALCNEQYRWLVTGGAGFIGSHICRALLQLGQEVIALDNLSTGRRENLDWIQSDLTKEQRLAFLFREGDIRDRPVCLESCAGVDFILHQAALGSVPRSLDFPLETNDVNVTGSLNVFLAARDSQVRKIVYASSSSVYGDNPELPKREDQVCIPRSPYAVSKRSVELYAEVFAGEYSLQLTGLRYFNVFGPRQDPYGPYAAVIPRWIQALERGIRCSLYGDGTTTRDFCFVENVVQANILSALQRGERAGHRVLNIGYGERISLQELFQLIRQALGKSTELSHEPFRQGDVPHSLADITCARKEIGYDPTIDVREGILRTIS